MNLSRPLSFLLRDARSQLGGAVAALQHGARPVFEMRHTPEEIDGFTMAARAQREGRIGLSHAVGSGAPTLERSLEVIAVERLTSRAVAITFANDGLAPTPGQFLTLTVEVDGVAHRRSYSLCSDPSDLTRLTIATKRVAGGVVSNHLNDTARVGDRITVSGPHGRFGDALDLVSDSAPVILVGAGSGVTPLWSIALSVTRAQPSRPLTLVFANRGVADIMFRSDIARLSALHPSFVVSHLLERPSKALAALRGRLEGDNLAALPVDPTAQYFVCGPPPMMDAVERHLLAAGVPSDRLHFERFDLGRGAPPTVGRGPRGETHAVRFARSGRLLNIRDDGTVLAAARAAGLPLEFSCTMGGCAACKVRLVSGEVEMPEPHCLTTAERERGEILACIARPLTSLVIDA